MTTFSCQYQSCCHMYFFIQRLGLSFYLSENGIWQKIKHILTFLKQKLPMPGYKPGAPYLPKHEAWMYNTFIKGFATLWICTLEILQIFVNINTSDLSDMCDRIEVGKVCCLQLLWLKPVWCSHVLFSKYKTALWQCLITTKYVSIPLKNILLKHLVKLTIFSI